LENVGYVQLDDFLTDSCLSIIKAECMSLIKSNPQKKAFDVGNLIETKLFELQKSEFILNLSKKILSWTSAKIDKSDVRSVINIGHGNPEYKDKLFHFDSVYLTWALPIVMPEKKGKGAGAFWIYPNTRKFSNSIILNKLNWRIMKNKYLRSLYKRYELNFEPGKAYLFYGFRSWHGVGELAEGALRINHLIHIGEVIKKK